MTAELIAPSREDAAPVEAEPDDSTTDYALPIAPTLDEKHRLAAIENTRLTRLRMKEMIAAAAARRCGSIAPDFK